MNEFCPPDDSPWTIAGKEGGAIIYQAYAFTFIFEGLSGREGARTETAVGKGLEYGTMALPSGWIGSGGKVVKGINAAQDVKTTVVAITKTDPQLLKLARETFEGNQALSREANNLVAQVIKGNMNPGIDTRWIRKDIFELRSSGGARVYFRNTSDKIEILGYSN